VRPFRAASAGLKDRPFRLFNNAPFPLFVPVDLPGFRDGVLRRHHLHHFSSCLGRVFKRLLSLLASIVLATLPLADDETPLVSKREGPKIGLEDDV